MDMKNKYHMGSEGYKHVKNIGDGCHILEEIESGKREVWFVNKNHASYGFIYKNTHLEFARSLSFEEAKQYGV
jgi:hypothetical protein